jgi:predicted TIM-barrel fold metal-dependent hydrolase
LSGAYRITGGQGMPYADVLPLACKVLEVNPERCVWGSDWPHPACPIPMPNDGDLLDLLADWAPDPTLRDRVLASNPAALYDFPQPGLPATRRHDIEKYGYDNGLPGRFEP